MAGKPLLVRDRHSADDELSPRDERVRVESLPDSHA
jgi:hypothetical protein